MVRPLVLAACLAFTACTGSDADSDRLPSSMDFPRPDRPVSSLGADRFAAEEDREAVQEAEVILDHAKLEEGMTIADLGAGSGYYLPYMSERVGPSGRVVAQDIDEDTLRQLGLKVERERLENVSILRGDPDDPKLPGASFDRVFLIHMYHEVAEPYAFLWRLHSALREDARVIVVEVDRPTDQHGIPPGLLFCEFKAVGYRLGAFVRKPDLNAYYARFDPAPSRPKPSDIEPCSAEEEMAAVSE